MKTLENLFKSKKEKNNNKMNRIRIFRSHLRKFSIEQRKFQ